MKEYSYGIAPYKIIDNKIYLFVNKSSKESLLGFFKGKIEKNETIKECVIREVLEESNLIIKKEYLENYFEQTYSKKDVGIFLIDSDNIDFSILNLNKEIYSCEWITLENLYSNIILNQKDIVNQMILYFKNIQKIKIKNLFKNS